MKHTLTTLTTLALHQTARVFQHVAELIKPEGVCIPNDAPVTFTASPWFYSENNALVIEDKDNPVHAFPNHVTTLMGVTVATTLDNSNVGGDYPMVYVLLNDMRDPLVLLGRDEEGDILEEDMREVV